MKFKKYFISVLVILLALGLSITAICYAANIREMNISLVEPLHFDSPDYIMNKFSENNDVSADMNTAPTIFNGSIVDLLTTTTEETSTEIPTTTEEATTEKITATEAPTEEPTSEEITTEAIIFPEDFSANYYNDSPFVTVGTEYFNDAVFIGNSRLQGFILYSKVPDLRSYTYVGLSVKTYFTTAGFTVDGQSVTAAQALEMNPDFKKVYLKFGINELGWVSTEQFIIEYKKILDHIYSCNPTAIVYVHSVLPVSEHALERDATLSKDKILEYNNALMNMASEYGACYLDVASIFTGEDGYMPPDLAFDGIHLHVNSVQLWLKYLLGHGIEEN